MPTPVKLHSEQGVDVSGHVGFIIYCFEIEHKFIRVQITSPSTNDYGNGTYVI
jgi:hypothetical protein